jgi:transposase
MTRGKRSYRAVDVKRLDQTKLAEEVAGKHIVFAVDVAKQKDYGVFMTGSRQKLATIKWESLSESVEVMDLLRKLPAGQLEVAMEPTGTYGDAFRVMAQDAGIPVYQVGAKRTHDAAEAWDGVPSMHDAKAAEVIARLHLDGASVLWERRSDEERELAATIMMIGVHNRAYTSLINNIEARLARHWPELTEHLDLTLVTLLELLARVGGPRSVQERPEEAVSLMVKVGRTFLSDAKIQAVVRSAKQTIGVPMIEAEERCLSELAKEARHSQQRENEARITAERLVQKSEESRRIGQVVGKVTAAVIKANIGSVEKYDSAASLEKALGLNLKVKSSGKKAGQLGITKRGSSLPRKFLYLAALRLLQSDSLVRLWYEAKVQRSGGVKKKAVIAVMRKLVRALWYVARGDQFDSSKLFNEKKLKSSLKKAR